MLAFASASGISHENDHVENCCFDSLEVWPADGQRLVNWQVELVDCCQVINEQLSQIRNDLKVQPFAGDTAPVSLRIAESLG